jgi:hypothetical protein
MVSLGAVSLQKPWGESLRAKDDLVEGFYRRFTRREDCRWDRDRRRSR